jgi:histidine triad (HIT) family protein
MYIHPQAPVHILIIPKQHIATLNDSGDVLLLGKLMHTAVHFSQRVQCCPNWLSHGD